MILAVRMARMVAVVVSVGFAYGGLVGIIDSTDPAPVKAVATALLTALLALHLRNCVRRSDGARPRGWHWTLAAQAVLTGIGMIWFADTWYGNSGFLAAAILLLVRRPLLAWTGFGLVVVAQFGAALPVRPTVTEAVYLAVGHAAFVGVALYTAARLADLVVDLRDTRLALAAAEVGRQRLNFARALNDRVGASLRRVVERGEAMLASPDPTTSQAPLREALDTARSALNEARSVAHGLHDGAAGSPGVAEPDRVAAAQTVAKPRRVAGDLTIRTVTVLSVATVVLMIVPPVVRQFLRLDLSGAESALFFVLLAAFVGCYLLAIRPGPDGRRPRWWPLLFAVLVVLAFAPLWVFEPLMWHVGYFLSGVALVLLRGPLRWVVAVPLIVQDTVLLVVWDAPLGAPTVMGQAYQAVWAAERAVIVLALALVAGSVVRLVAARADLARAAVVRDRLRFAQDLHDLFGYSLSILVLKSELAVRLLDRDAPRARAELTEGLAVARQALADLATVADGYRSRSLAAEAETARAVLSAAGVAVDGSVTAPTLPAETDVVLATVLREGVTNVLRHSAARRCRLSVETAGSTVRLTLCNDGVPPAPARRPGMGLDSLTRRVAAVGGHLTAEPTDEGFRLSATVPLQPALLGGDADRVDAVAGVEPRDGRRQVVAHGSHAQEQG